MIHKLNGILFFLLITFFSYSQTVLTENGESKTGSDSVSSTKSSKVESFVETDSIKKNAPKELIITPTIGLGTGMFSFYGDLYNKHFQAPMVSRVAFDLSVSQPVNDYLLLNFHVIFGKLGANERLAPNNRNLNFESQIRVGGLNLEYNFDHFLPQNRVANPYISLGFESFEFLSKTDAKDKNGNTYYYWSDGAVRNIDEQASDANLAIELQRDYTYESDVREMNLDKFGKYPERSFAIPVGIGATFKINDFFDFKLGTSMHFTFTDYIDGVTEKSTGNRRGNTMNDKFMMTSFSLHYNLGIKNAEKKKATKKLEDHYNDVDFAALDLDDMDKDGVTDWNDQCQGTPIGVPVDANGCPLDEDEDGIPNFRDDEIKSPKDAIVSTKGVEMNDSLIAYQYGMYMDSTGDFGLVDNRDAAYNKLKQKEYTVKLGTFKKGLPSNLMTKFLSINDISSTNTGDSTTVYTAGKFSNYEDAEKRRQQLISDGLTDTRVVYKQFSKFYDVPELADNTNNDLTARFTGKLVGADNTPLANSKVNLVDENGKILQTGTTDFMGVVHFEYLKPDRNVLLALDENDTQLKKLKKIFLTDNMGTKVKEVYPAKVAFSLPETNINLLAVNSKNTTTNNSAAITGKNNTDANNNIVANNNVPANNTVNNTSVNTNPVANNTLAANNTKNTTTTNDNPVANNTVAANNTKNIKNTTSSSNSILNTPGTVLRVQLGAYRKRLSKAVFRDISDLIEVKTEDGIYKYMTGSFTSMEPAAKLKVDMLLNGYSGAFITAYKDGKRITLKEAGATLAENNNVAEKTDNTAVSGVNKKLVRFKVQVGVYKNDPPDSKLAIFSKLKELSGEKTSSGLTRYVVGSFSSYEEALAFKNKAIKTYGLTDAFVVASFNNEYISIPEALEILK